MGKLSAEYVYPKQMAPASVTIRDLLRVCDKITTDLDYLRSKVLEMQRNADVEDGLISPIRPSFPLDPPLRPIDIPVAKSLNTKFGSSNTTSLSSVEDFREEFELNSGTLAILEQRFIAEGSGSLKKDALNMLLQDINNVTIALCLSGAQATKLSEFLEGDVIELRNFDMTDASKIPTKHLGAVTSNCLIKALPSTTVLYNSRLSAMYRHLRPDNYMWSTSEYIIKNGAYHMVLLYNFPESAASSSRNSTQKYMFSTVNDKTVELNWWHKAQPDFKPNNFYAIKGNKLIRYERDFIAINSTHSTISTTIPYLSIKNRDEYSESSPFMIERALSVIPGSPAMQRMVTPYQQVTLSSSGTISPALPQSRQTTSPYQEPIVPSPSPLAPSPQTLPVPNFGQTGFILPELFDALINMPMPQNMPPICPIITLHQLTMENFNPADPFAIVLLVTKIVPSLSNYIAVTDDSIQENAILKLDAAYEWQPGYTLHVKKCYVTNDESSDILIIGAELSDVEIIGRDPLNREISNLYASKIKPRTD